MSDDQLRVSLDSKCEDERRHLTTGELDQPIEKDFRKDMRIQSARLGMEYNAWFILVLIKNGLTCLTEDNERLVLSHIIYAIRPTPVHKRLEPDLEVIHNHLHENF